MSKNQKFECIKCGACCRHLDAFYGIYDDLDRGDGICMFYDSETCLCSIYKFRPNKCRIGYIYNKIKDIISSDKYFKLTIYGCFQLRLLDKK